MSRINPDIDCVATLRITLEDIEPAIWRRIVVPMTTNLRGLHDIIQAVMLFEDCHLFQFDVGDRRNKRRYGIPNRESGWEEIADARSFKLGKLVEKGIERFTYTYDFGDDWRHTIIIEAVSNADPAIEYPLFVEGARRAPPEDVGGVPGFEAFLNAMAKPQHPEYVNLIRWYGGIFDPEDIGLDEIGRRIKKIVRRRTIGKAAFAKNRDIVS